MIRRLQFLIRDEISLIRRKNFGLPDDWGRTYKGKEVEKRRKGEDWLQEFKIGQDSKDSMGMEVSFIVTSIEI